MRFLILTAPASDAAALTSLMRRGRPPVKMVSYSAQPGREGVGVLEAPSRFDAEEFIRALGRTLSGKPRLLPL